MIGLPLLGIRIKIIHFGANDAIMTRVLLQHIRKAAENFYNNHFLPVKKRH